MSEFKVGDWVRIKGKGVDGPVRGHVAVVVKANNPGHYPLLLRLLVPHPDPHKRAEWPGNTWPAHDREVEPLEMENPDDPA